MDESSFQEKREREEQERKRIEKEKEKQKPKKQKKGGWSSFGNLFQEWITNVTSDPEDEKHTNEDEDK